MKGRTESGSGSVEEGGANGPPRAAGSQTQDRPQRVAGAELPAEEPDGRPRGKRAAQECAGEGGVAEIRPGAQFAQASGSGPGVGDQERKDEDTKTEAEGGSAAALAADTVGAPSSGSGKVPEGTLGQGISTAREAQAKAAEARRANTARPGRGSECFGARRRDALRADFERRGGFAAAEAARAAQAEADRLAREATERRAQLVPGGASSSVEASSSSGSTRLPSRPLAGDAGSGGANSGGRPEVHSLLECVIGRGGGDRKPRPFRNVLGVWGGGSCYINAALQAFFASETVQRTLARVVSSSAGAGGNLAAFATRASIVDIRAEQQNRFRQSGGRMDELCLAVTFATAMQGWLHGRSVVGSALLPALVLAHCYRGEQDDAVQFLLLNCLSVCPQVNACCQGRYSAPDLECSRCGHRWAGHSTMEDRLFTVLPIHPTFWRTGAAHADVQVALDMNVEQQVDEHFDAFCPLCHGRAGAVVKAIASGPKVLVVQLEQWRTERIPDGLEYVRAEHALGVNDSVNVGGYRYSLRGVMLHLGSSPRGGHWVALARHGEGPGVYYLYNDIIRREFTRERITSVMDFDGQRFYVAGLVYERIEEAVVPQVVV